MDEVQWLTLARPPDVLQFNHCLPNIARETESREAARLVKILSEGGVADLATFALIYKIDNTAVKQERGRARQPHHPGREIIKGPLESLRRRLRQRMDQPNAQNLYWRR